MKIEKLAKYRIQKNCVICGKQFLAQKDCKSRNQIYCSKICYSKNLIGRKATEKQLQSLRLGRLACIGRVSSLKGKPRTIEICQKISQAKKGKLLSIEHKNALSRAKIGKPIRHFIENRLEISQKLSKSLKGKPQLNLRREKHWNWQGGITAINFQIRNSLEMKKWRRSVFEKDDYTCQICFKRGGHLIADHIKPFSLFPELRFAIDNGRTLCVECHKKTETYLFKIRHFE